MVIIPGLADPKRVPERVQAKDTRLIFRGLGDVLMA